GPAGHVLKRLLEGVVSSCYVHQLVTVGGQGGRNIETSVKGNSLRIAARYRYAIDLRAAATIAGENQRTAIRRVLRFGVDQWRTHHPSQARTIKAHGVDLRDAIA